MPSFFDTVYSSFSDVLTSTFVDSVPILYRPSRSGDQREVRAIIRSVDRKEVFNEESIQYVDVVEIVLRVDDDAFWSGISRARLSGQFEFFGFTWEQMVTDSAGINRESRTYVTLSVRRTGIASIGHPNRIREPQA